MIASQLCAFLLDAKWRTSRHGLGRTYRPPLFQLTTHPDIQWAVASIFILFVGMSMAELASAAPTSGGVSYHSASLTACDIDAWVQLYFWTHSLSSPRWKNLLAWLVGCACSLCSGGTVADGGFVQMRILSGRLPRLRLLTGDAPSKSLLRRVLAPTRPIQQQMHRHCTTHPCPIICFSFVHSSCTAESIVAWY